ncbi:DUF6090 family protein [Namhaeicola litoreus]|uniref:DUF6090 family protein n=1 Tax=Namhaeicola litoreus TaxID=1052145 RepID=A0ABW3Y214_9FLAO
MLPLFRKIRKQYAHDNQFLKYLRYAIGEIVLVVIGILIALQINNWNEKKKEADNERYILQEVLANLREDSVLIKEIVIRRKLAQAASFHLLDYVGKEKMNPDTLKLDMARFLSFERYFPINNAYEVLKSKGLKLSNRELTTKLSRYYDFEQKKVTSSIYDIETNFNKIFSNREGLLPFITEMELNTFVNISDPNDPVFIEELKNEVMSFKDNNGGTINSLLNFQKINDNLIKLVDNELQKLSDR